MEYPNEYTQYYHNFVAAGNEEVHPVSERFMQDATNCINMNMRPPEVSTSEVKPVHNFSIQTGEEFALEFMRDRVLPRKPVVSKAVGDPDAVTGYMDLKGILGINRAESETGSDVSMLALSEKGPKEFDRKNSSLYEGKTTRGSMQSKHHNSSEYGSSRGFHGYASSGMADGSSMKIKVLCSFGGKILPRPSDGKLRYVGGETRIIRINKDISWQELKRRTSTILDDPHTIKYQLPGEDLDALVSVSSEEDLQNMMEECNFLRDGEGAKKLRLFLFTLSDLEDSHYSLSIGDVDSEFQYVVAVNCMEMGIRKNSGMHDIASSSANDLDALMGQNANRGVSSVPATIGLSSSAHGGGAVPSTGILPAQPIVPGTTNSYPQHPLQFQGQVIHHEDSKGYQLHGGDVHPSVHMPREESITATSLNGLSTNQQKTTEAESNQGHTKGNLPAEEAFGSTVNGASVKEFSDLPPKGEKRHQEHIQSSPSDAVYVPRVSEPINPENPNPFDFAYTSEHAHSEPNSFNMNHNELPATQRPYLSVNIPREQGELLSRLTKSDDSLNPQFLMSHSQMPVGQQDSVTKSSGKFQHMNAVAESDMHAGSNMVENQVVKFAADKDCVSRQTTSSAVDGKDARQDNPFMDRNSETSCPTYNHKEHLGDAVEVGHARTDVSQPSNSEQHDHASTLPELKWEDEAAQNSSGNVAESILIDINDRFPRDLLSDIFSQAILFEESSSVNQLPHDGAGLSMNIENHEPKNWSFFQNLAKDDFRKDVSLIDQDHPIYSSGLAKVDGEVSGHYQYTTLSTDGVPASDVDSRIFGEYGQRDLPDTVLADQVTTTSDYNPSQAKYSEVVQFDGVGAPYSDYEEAIQETKHVGLPPLDPSIVNFDISTLQIIKNEDLEELRELGSGTFGTVYHGKWRGTDVAIKRIKKSCFTGRSSEQERLTVEFWHEAEILSKLHHPNVVAFYGVVQDGPGGTLATVTEFMVDGSLRHVLLRKDRHLDRRKRLIIAMDAAFGMEYLHSKNIVHFDLKCDNLLVNLKDPSRPICKVGDFGLSKIKRNTLVSGGVRGTLPWMAPELLNGSSSKVSEKVDVFSFGIVLWEILTGEEPYANMHYGAIIGGIVNNTLRPLIPNYCDAEWRMLMEQCWAPNPAVRPSFTEIAGRLRAMAAACQTTKAQGPKASH
ncbi:uncharacterized protein LOC104906362 [Beta vulgaris subsp. vulgaris]|uniref:uncharacterized protein LOC104906362 n=1 Tax=Beta vulgaris subsp. vulgaris TaxID=3555 RepID=UPI00053FB7B4|nr:uncharacterized protein LOC104906362 [Beta vulgaris subsp. vulgaris]